MPLYEYSCPECHERFEVLQRMGAGSEGLTCPRCGSGRVEKQFSTFASGSSSAAAGFSSSAAGCSPSSGFR